MDGGRRRDAEPSLTKFTPALARIAGCAPVSYQDEHVWDGH